MTIQPAWTTRKLAHAFNRIGSGTTPTSSNADYYSTGEGTPWITTAELRETYINSTSTNVTAAALTDFSTLRIYAKNSVLMAMYGATIGRLGMTTIEAACNQACCVLEHSDVFENRFLFYWLWHRRPELIALSVGGGQPNLSQQDLKSETALCPPLDTQKRIAAFLDEKTAQIDALIAKKQALLERLAEKRQAIITQAVTRGLNPGAPMKDSGIEWLGEIPAHWKMRRLRFLLDGDTLNGLYKPKDQFHEDGVPFIQMGEAFRASRFSAGTKDRVLTEGAELRKWSLRAGDFLVARRSIVFDGSGKAVLIEPADELHLFESSMIRLRLSAPVFSPFLSYYFMSSVCRAFVLSITKQVTISGIDSQQLKNIVIPCPSHDESQRIAAFLDDVSSRIDRGVDLVKKSIGCLAKYRSTLITAAVTGQIERLR